MALFVLILFIHNKTHTKNLTFEKLQVNEASQIMYSMENGYSFLDLLMITFNSIIK